MDSRRVMSGLVLLAVLGLVAGSLGCGESCEERAEAACKPFLNEELGDGKKYDACYRQSLAECGYTG